MTARVSYQILGSLQQMLMEYFWEHGWSSTTALQKHTNRHISTVSVTLQKMAENGLLIQEKPWRKSEGYFYTPRVTKEELIIAAIEMLVWDLKASQPSASECLRHSCSFDR